MQVFEDREFQQGLARGGGSLSPKQPSNCATVQDEAAGSQVRKVLIGRPEKTLPVRVVVQGRPAADHCV